MSTVNAIASNRVSAVVGYSLEVGHFNEVTENLPQLINIFGEANTANQSGLSTTPLVITSAAQAATAYGAGSPIHGIARILFPVQGGGVSVPVKVYPQAAAVDSTARVQTITVTGTASANGTHYVKVAGRTNVDGVFYAVNIVKANTATQVATKIKDAINNVYSSPVTATSSGAVVTVTTKWTGLTAQALNLAMFTNDLSLGCTYAVAETDAGSGTPAISASLAMISNEWTTLLINGYGTVSAVLDELEAFNGVASTTNPTGRYTGTTFKPLVALTGSVADDPSSTTSSRKTQMTVVICPASLSPGMQYEAAANVAALLSNVAQNTPESDVIYQSYPDMPLPDASSIPAMQSYAERDRIVQLGCSTAMIESGAYKIVDLVTTNRPDGETPPPYRWVSALIKHWNVRYTYLLMQQINVVGKTLVRDQDTVSVNNYIKPKMLKSLLGEMFDSLTQRAIIVDPEFSKKSVTVSINATNADRLDDEWSYKISGITRQCATVVKGGMNFGKLGA